MTEKISKEGQIANYNETPATRIDSEPSALEVDQFGNLKQTMATVLQNVDDNGSESDTMGVSPTRRADAFQAIFSSDDASTAAQVKAATAAKRIYITDIIVSTDTAMNITFQDNAGTPVVAINPIYLPAVSVFSKSFSTPVMLGVNVDLNIKASVSGNVSATVLGYVI